MVYNLASLVFPTVYLGLLDVIVLVAIIFSVLYLAYKAQDNLRYILLAVAMTLIIVLLISPVVIAENNLRLLGQMGLYSIFLFFALDTILPPYPSSELALILPLRAIFNIPLHIGELIAQGIAGLILIITFIFMPSFWVIFTKIVQETLASITFLTWLLILLWTGTFVLIAYYTRNPSENL